MEADAVLYPEYLVSLRTYGTSSLVVQRTLHAIPPPPVGPLPFHLKDIIWSPGLFERDEERSNRVLDSIFIDASAASQDNVIHKTRRRRGFGLELETVQLPPDCEEGCFTHQQ